MFDRKTREDQWREIFNKAKGLWEKIENSSPGKRRGGVRNFSI